MKTRNDAAKILIGAGWTPTEVKQVLGNLPAPAGAGQTVAGQPWWGYLDKDWHIAGNPLVEEWLAWIDRDGSAQD